MTAQAAIAAKTAITAIAVTGTAYSINPRGKDAKGVLDWVYPGATSLDDVRVDFSYREPTATRKSTKATLRVFSPKTAVNSTTGVTEKIGDLIASCDFTFPDSATSAERQKVVDIFTSVLATTEFRSALNSGDVMY